MRMNPVWPPPLWWRHLLIDIDRTIKRGFHVDPMSFTVLAAFGMSILLFAICMPLICCCARKKKNRRNVREKASEPLKRKYPLSVAKFDEFDALSPLVVSPTASNPSSFRQKRLETDRTLANRELFLRQHNIRLDESPPAPRRFNGGRTVIVPLASNSSRASCRPLVVPLLGTPDSKVTSFEIGTTKSCATIPEDDEFEIDDEETNHAARHYDEDEITAEGDLVSIDRTYISTRDSRSYFPKFRPPLGHYIPSPIPVLPPMPEFQLAPPTWSPPPVPDTVHSTPVRQRQISSRHDTQGQSNLTTPEMSSCVFDSIMETAGSDFMIALDVDTEKMIIEFDESSSADSIQQQLKNLQLQKIEEETEQFDEASSISRFLYSSSGSSLSKFNNPNVRLPRSISQQLEYMVNNAH